MKHKDTKAKGKKEEPNYILQGAEKRKKKVHPSRVLLIPKMDDS